MPSLAPALVGAIEAGGTKFVCAVGSGPEDLVRTEFPTLGDPQQVLSLATGWLLAMSAHGARLAAIGIGCFGPLDLDSRSPTYGHITSTPKPGWAAVDIVGAVRSSFPGLPVAFDTDVNAAVLGEWRWGNGVGLSDLVYITIGTGIGGGAVVGGRLLHGLVHPEMGHMLLPRLPGDSFKGICPYHGDCWEGLCSGPALRARCGQAASSLSANHEAWTLEAHYCALALANLVFTLSPQRIIVGGSVRKAGGLGSERFFQMLREALTAALRGYVVSPTLDREMNSFVVPPLLGDRAGICGAIALAQDCSPR